MTAMHSGRRTKEGEATGSAATQTLEMTAQTSKNKESGSVWESNPLTAFFKPPTGFEDQGPHQRCKHSRSLFSGAPRLGGEGRPRATQKEGGESDDRA